jgi:hypothetical protein
MFAYLAAIEFLFDDADLPDVDASRLYRDRADEAKAECKDGVADDAAAAADDEDVEAYADIARGLKYFCAIGDNERIECEVVIGTYFDFSEAAAVEEVDSIEPVAAVFVVDDKDFSVSSLASFKSFSASTSMFTEEVKEEALGVEAIGFVSTSPSSSSPFTVFPDFKEDFKSSKDGSSSTRASSAVFTAEERSPLEDPEEDEAAELAACELLLFAEKYASSASLSEMLLSSLFVVPDIILVFDAPSSSFFRAAENSTFVFASSAVSSSSFDDFFSSDNFFSSDDDDALLLASLSKLKYPSSFFIVSSVSRSSLALCSSPSRESDSIVVEPNFPSATIAGAFGGTKTSPSLLLLLSYLPPNDATSSSPFFRLSGW